MRRKFYDKISKEFVDAFSGKINVNSIVITSHISPDDDSISSVLSVYYYLINYLGIPQDKVRIIYTGEKILKWSYFANFEKIEFVDDLVNHLEGVDLLILLDGSGWMRFSKDEKIKKFRGTTFCIDHHPKPENKFDYHTLVTPFSSTAELIYRLFFANQKLDSKICEIILLGILGDTANYKYVIPEISEVFGVSKKLVDAGDIKVHALQVQYKTIDWKAYTVLGQLMKNTKMVELEGWPGFVYSYVDQNFPKKCEIEKVFLDEGFGEFAEYLTNIRGISWGFTLQPSSYGYTKISLRSIPGSVNVRDVVFRMGVGGGHDRAAGGRIKASSPEEAIETIFGWMKKNMPLVN